VAHILVIDDDARFRGAVTRTLTSAGHEVTQADNGVEALVRYEAKRPELVITDLAMPGKGGIETILELRQKDPDLPIVAMSGDAREWQIGRGMGISPESTIWLLKPFSPLNLIENVSGLLTRAQRYAAILGD
jgi:CheY-like chemotaxis protein